MTASTGMIRVVDAYEHNLQHLDLDVPRDCIVAFTGVSGSGKSSLAFGTLYAESRRRFLESIAPYARRLLDTVAAPRVGDITGLPPSIALQQSRGSSSGRSSVGTVTTISNVLRMLFSRGGTYPTGAPRLDSNAFSPNTAEGGCRTCHGLGRTHEVDVESLVPDDTLTINEGAVEAWPGGWRGKNYRDIARTLGVDVDVPWHELPTAARDLVLTSIEKPTVTVTPTRGPGQLVREYQGTFASASTYVMHTFATTKSAMLRNKAARHLRTSPCPSCGGKRLGPDALAVRFGGIDIADAGTMTVTDLAAFLTKADTEIRAGLTRAASDEAATALIGDLLDRLAALTELGLGYLSLDRSTPTLSAGELQRLRLATQLRSGLFGVLYVLDEPSAGLHPADTEALIDAIRRLRAAGNSVFVVEHNLDVVSAADWIVDIGPGAGDHGGRVLYCGPSAGLAEIDESVTRRYLVNPTAVTSSGRVPAQWITVNGIARFNLRDLDVRLPLGVLTTVTGVSGSGKSTLVNVIADVIADNLGTTMAPPVSDIAEDNDDPLAPSADDGGHLDGVETDGLDAVARVVRVDQTPIGRTPRSNIATYTSLFDTVRKLFAAAPLARERGYTPGRFSFNVAEGRCPQCEGSGEISVGLLFLPDATSVCSSCHGARYNDETLEVRIDGRSIADVLELTVADARDTLADVPAAARVLRVLCDVGLEYIRLGQSATTLSGGEAQRVKLASELQRVRPGHTLYVLDEPTSGLHPADTERLMAILQNLVDAGNTVLLAEHDLPVIASADWVIDMGPSGGDGGGRIVAAGTPADVCVDEVSVTGRYLARHLESMG
ncbi:ABC transporter [Actinomycetes bacterium M1A6_2h]